MRFHAGQATATRRAILAGWDFQEGILCPHCQDKLPALTPDGPLAPVIALFRARPAAMTA